MTGDQAVAETWFAALFGGSKCLLRANDEPRRLRKDTRCLRVPPWHALNTTVHTIRRATQRTGHATQNPVFSFFCWSKGGRGSLAKGNPQRATGSILTSLVASANSLTSGANWVPTPVHHGAGPCGCPSGPDDAFPCKSAQATDFWEPQPENWPFLVASDICH